jgi:hypothetical protein
MALSYSNAKKIAITDYLGQLGFEPARVRGNDYWYRSPFRSERDASFKVNVKMNLWYDHGEGIGGTLLDLGSKLHSCTVKEFVERLENSNLSFDRSPVNAKLPPENRIEIISAYPLADGSLIEYLNGRKIDLQTAQDHCKEIEFKITKRTYKAVGFRNNSGGFELRNTWFKGSSSPKDVTLFKNGFENLIVTEGFIDYLSLHQLKDNNIQRDLKESDHLILNSISFIRKALPVIKTYKVRQLFLDNDQAAEKAKAFLRASNIEFSDRSGFYAKHKDVNDLLTKSYDLHLQPPRKRSLRP